MEQESVLGRAHDAGIHLVDDEVSRRHARLYRDSDGSYRVEDLGSTNGTYVNGERVSTSRELRYGDQVGLGSETLLVFSRGDRLGEQIMHMQRVNAVGQLATAIAHDFNNLLGSILMGTSLLREAGHVDEAGLCDLDLIETAARRAVGVTAQMLAFARTTSVDPKTADVAALVAETRRMLVCPKQISVSSQVHEGLQVVVDEHLMSQVLLNLCINAVDAMPDGGEISIETEAVGLMEARTLRGGKLRRGNYVAVHVRDTGTGISRDTLARIFDPFFTTKPRGKGTGLGLATVQRVVRDHGGAVDVSSHRGSGTTFSVYLPQAGVPTAADVVTMMPERTATSPVVVGSVLVVDDETAIAESVQRVLERVGLRVVAADSGEAAIRLCDDEHFDLIIMDLDMPGVGGEEAMREILDRDPDARILVSTGLADEPTCQRLVAAGAIGVFPKPYDATHLRQKVVEQLVGG